MKRNHHTSLVIRYSCLTGKAVWIYYAPSDSAMWTAYWRARQREVERVHNWSQAVAQRRSNILRLLSDCTSSFPLTGDLPSGKREAALRLRQAAESPNPCYRDFYEHLMEERRRRQSKRKPCHENPTCLHHYGY